MDAGQLVPDDVTMEISQRLAKGDVDSGVLLDGFQGQPIKRMNLSSG